MVSRRVCDELSFGSLESGKHPARLIAYVATTKGVIPFYFVHMAVFEDDNLIAQFD